MAEPKKRHTSTRSGNRRSHLGKKMQNLSTCPKCKSAILTHFVCPQCGYYKGNDILELERIEREKKERRQAQEESEKK